MKTETDATEIGIKPIETQLLQNLPVTLWKLEKKLSCHCFENQPDRRSLDVSQLKNELVSEVPTLLQEALNVSIETNEENQLKPQVHEKITLPSNLEEEEIETVKDQKGNFLSFDDLDLEKFEKAREQGVVYSVSGFLGKNQNSDIKCESRHKVHRINFQDSLKGHPCSKTTVTCVERCDSHDKVLYSRKKD